MDTPRIMTFFGEFVKRYNVVFRGGLVRASMFEGFQRKDEDSSFGIESYSLRRKKRDA